MSTCAAGNSAGGGTGAAALLVVRSPRLGAAVAFAGLCGLAVAPYLRFLESGLLEFAVLMATFLAAGAELTGSLRRAAEVSHIVGMDLVELAPMPGLHACDFLAAQLAYKMMNYSMSGTKRR